MFRKTVVVVTLLGSALLYGCGQEETVIPEPSSRPAKIITVSVNNNKTTRVFPATIEAGDKAILAFRVQGVLDSLNVRAGQEVKEGEELATINPDEYRLLKKQAEAQYQLIDVEYARAKKLYKDKFISEQDYDAAVANRKTAKASLDQAKANLSYTKLLAPYDGTISLVFAENYEYASINEPIMNIQTNELFYVVFQLPDYLLRHLNFNATEAVAIFDSFPNQRFPLKFEEVNTEVDNSTSSYTVKMSMPRPKDLSLLPGMSGTVKVSLPKRGGDVLPLSAIEEKEGHHYVWRVKQDGRVEKVKVQLNDKRQVMSGLNDMDQIISAGISSLEEGDKVRIWVKEEGL